MVLGSDGATAIAPIEPTGWLSKIGVQTVPAIGGLPDAPVDRAKIKSSRVARHTRHGTDRRGGNQKDKQRDRGSGPNASSIRQSVYPKKVRP
jgi:hypothetical protein